MLAHAFPRILLFLGVAAMGPSAAVDQGEARPSRRRPPQIERRLRRPLRPTGSSAPPRPRPCRWRTSRHTASVVGWKVSNTHPPASGPNAMPRLAKRGDGAEHRAHDARAEIFAHQHGVERHHAAIGGAEHHRQRVEFAELADREIGRDRQRLHEQAARPARAWRRSGRPARRAAGGRRGRRSPRRCRR